MHGLNWENKAYKLKRSIARETLPTPWELDAIDLAIPTVAVALFLISGEFRKVL